MNNPFDYLPSPECNEAFRTLVSRLETLKHSLNAEDKNFWRELQSGKMLGVLIATDCEGIHHILYAFSGQLGTGGFHYPGFVGPVFDYLQPDGHFRRCERNISLQNKMIAAFIKGPLASARTQYNQVKECSDAELAAARENYRQSKAKRDSIRTSGTLNNATADRLIRQSQFEKAELQRLKKRLASKLAPYIKAVEDAEHQLSEMKERRSRDSEELQQWLFNNFRVLNALGESKSLTEIFACTSAPVPPSGAGECCAPKLLQEAYRRHLKPVSIAEYWFGAPKDGEIRKHGQHYPACRGKCLPVLAWMLQGTDVGNNLDVSYGPQFVGTPEVLFENEWFCVVNKPSGMLSVPGKGSQLSVQQWLTERYGTERGVKAAHRLDQDTSGLLVATFGELAYTVMQKLFATRSVTKRYVAILAGNYREQGLPRNGRIELPLSPDLADRPRQRVDRERGKEAVTDYEFTDVSDKGSRINLYPHTGRTHQLRVHSASEMGLGMPIVGDRLYGEHRESGFSSRLLLHAGLIEFIFPLDKKHYCFELPAPF